MRTYRCEDLTDEQRDEIAAAQQASLRTWLADGNHCIHRPAGQICDECRADHDEDPTAWMEYGEHEAGRANWRTLQEEIAEIANAPRASIESDPNIPF